MRHADRPLSDQIAHRLVEFLLSNVHEENGDEISVAGQ